MITQFRARIEELNVLSETRERIQIIKTIYYFIKKKNIKSFNKIYFFTFRKFSNLLINVKISSKLSRSFKKQIIKKKIFFRVFFDVPLILSMRVFD